MSAPAQDAVWKALADPTRRAMLDVLREGPRTTGALCRRFRSLSRCGVMKHLGLLEDANLILVQRKGRFRWNHINPTPLKQAYHRWLAPYVAD
jgi:DNA-binding transcriptional ArsR family regulator